MNRCSSKLVRHPHVAPLLLSLLLLVPTSCGRSTDSSVQLLIPGPQSVMINRCALRGMTAQALIPGSPTIPFGSPHRFVNPGLRTNNDPFDLGSSPPEFDASSTTFSIPPGQSYFFQVSGWYAPGSIYPIRSAGTDSILPCNPPAREQETTTFKSAYPLFGQTDSTSIQGSTTIPLTLTLSVRPVSSYTVFADASANGRDLTLELPVSFVACAPGTARPLVLEDRTENTAILVLPRASETNARFIGPVLPGRTYHIHTIHRSVSGCSSTLSGAFTPVSGTVSRFTPADVAVITLNERGGVVSSIARARNLALGDPAFFDFVSVP